MRTIVVFQVGILWCLFGVHTAHGLTVSPAKVEIQVDPGQSVYGEIELFNEQVETKTFFISYENFESRGDTGAPYFTGGRTGLATWITTDADISIASGERVIVPYSITVPASAKPGGYFAAIFFGSQPPQGDGGGEVTIGGKVGVLLLLRVSGEVAEAAGLTDFGTPEQTRFFSVLPITFEYGFNNVGGDRVVPRGEIQIRNTFRLNSATLLANDREGSVLPDSTRRFEVVWNEGEQDVSSGGFFARAKQQLVDFHFGWYTADLNVTWGASDQTARADFSFVIIPWQLLSIVGGVVGGLWFVMSVWLKRYKRRIIAEMMQHNE